MKKVSFITSGPGFLSYVVNFPLPFYYEEHVGLVVVLGTREQSVRV